MKKRILVLGATGMLGRVAYEEFKKTSNVTGTARRKTRGLVYYQFDKTPLANLIKRIKPDFIVNCIAQIGEGGEGLYQVNYLLPGELDNLSEEYKIKIINISTDAVFPDLSGEVYENNKPKPQDNYAKSKLMGETKKSINIRTSIIGLDPLEHKGLLESVLKKRITKSFLNQLWSGATTKQLSDFISWLTDDSNYESLFKKTNIIHFAPLGPLTKFEILNSFSELINGTQVKKNRGKKRTRILKSNYIDQIKLKKYTNNLEMALTDLIKFDKEYVKKIKKN